MSQPLDTALMGLKVHLVTESHPLQKTSLVVKASWAPRMRVSQVAGLQSPALGPLGWPYIISAGRRLSVLERKQFQRSSVCCDPLGNQDSSELEGGDSGCSRGPSL